MAMANKKVLQQECGTHQGLSGQGDNQTPVTAEQILALFNSLGLRQTRTRQLIAERLAKFAADGADFTVQELWQELRAVDRRIGRVTVYRAVEVLLSKKLMHYVSFADSSYRYRLGSGSHCLHLTCTQCQRVIHLSARLPPELLATIEVTTDFVLDRHCLKLFGRCASCRAKQKSYR